LRDDEEAPASATGLCGQLEILVPLAGLIDREEELTRLGKEIGRLEKDIQRLDGKLNNEKFLSRAPEAVVEKERRKREEQQQSLATLMQQRERISAI
jgi:valyl-tRNA synthetase